jgi:hypothetical protein
MNPFTTAIQKVIIGVLLLLIVALAVFGGLQWWEAERLQSKLDTCMTDAAGLRGALQVQNEAVAAWQKAASDAQGVSAKALAAARAANAAKGPEIKRLEALIAAGQVSDCSAAAAEVRKGLQ